MTPLSLDEVHRLLKLRWKHGDLAESVQARLWELLEPNQYLRGALDEADAMRRVEQAIAGADVELLRAWATADATVMIQKIRGDE